MFNINEIIKNIQKPITYLNGEINSFHPDTENSEIKFALGYPDLYEIGMSNLGIRILYQILNGIKGVACERFFAPGSDLEDILRKADASLFTLESRKPLKDFDIVGFSLSSELNYTNFVNLLSLSKIPVHSDERCDSDPIILAGGNCSFHPEPLSSFVDLWIVGEAEEAVVELIEAYKNLKGLKRFDIIKSLAEIKGVYAPMFYSVQADDTLKPVSARIPNIIERRIVADFENSVFPTKWIVPSCDIIHDRISLEIMRGCPQNCLFCQGGFCWKPVRKKSAEKLIELGLETYNNTGYEEISLLSFSASDHPEIEKIVMGLVEKTSGFNVAISFPSLRIDSFSFHLADRISQVKRTGLTFAPETGQSLRKYIGKNISDDRLLDLAKEAKKAGWRQLKLYFMIGLPCEEEKTISEIENLINEISRIIFVKCSFNTFIPKPHTPFQWEKFPESGYYCEITKRLKKNFSRNRFVSIKFHPYEMSMIECLLSRGNRKLGAVIEHVWNSGGKMENWSEGFVFDRWTVSMQEKCLDFADYLGDLPSICNRWKHIMASLPFEKLQRMRENFYRSVGNHYTS